MNLLPSAVHVSSSSSNGESTNDTPIIPLHKSALTTLPHPPPSPLHLERFRRETPREPLTDEQRFSQGYRTLLSPYSKVTLIEPMLRETASAEAPI